MLDTDETIERLQDDFRQESSLRLTAEEDAKAKIADILVSYEEAKK